MCVSKRFKVGQNFVGQCPECGSLWFNHTFKQTAVVSVADDQGGPVVLRLVRGSKQSSHTDPSHHVPAKRSRETC